MLKQIGYDLLRKKLGSIDVVLPADVGNRHDCVFTDNSTLMSTFNFLKEGIEGSAIEVGAFRWEGRDQLLKQSAKHASTAASLNLIQNVVLYENLIVDGFVLANDERAMSIAKALRGTVKALYLNDMERMQLGTTIDRITPLLQSLVTTKPELHKLAEWNAMADSLDIKLLQRFRTTSRQAGEGKVVTRVAGLLDTSDHALPRTYFYCMLAKWMGLPYSPHPARCPILEMFVEKQLTEGGVSDKHSVAQITTFKTLRAAGRDLIETFGYDLSLKIPPIAEYIVHTTEHKHNLLDRVFEVRESPHARDFRKWCGELHAALALGVPGLAKAQRLYKELDAACTAWSSDINNYVKYKKRKLKITWLSWLLGFEAEFEIKDPIVFGQPLRHLLFLNDIMSVGR